MTQAQQQKKYKAMLILDARNASQGVDALIDEVKAGFESVGAAVESVENLGTKDFQRVTDKKFPAGLYVQINFGSAPEVPAQIQERFRLNKAVNRILVETSA